MLYYISGNPYINSKVGIKGFNARRHFYKVIDVWDFGWNEELGTVPPENVNKTALSLVRKISAKEIHNSLFTAPCPLYIKRIQNDWFSESQP